MHGKAKEIARNALYGVNFEEYASNTTRMAEARLHPLLDSQINECFAAAMTESTSQFIACCEEIERLNSDRAFSQQLNKKATRVHTSASRLQF
jgi:hypothetical protein